MVLNDIIDQVSERPQSKATHFSSAYQVKAILFLFSYFNTLLWVSFQDDDDEGPKMKDIVFDCIKRTSDVMCVWDCCWLWIRTAEVSAIYLFLLFSNIWHLIFQVLSIIVFDPFTELFITLCIVVNVLFMSADHYDVEYDGM